MTEHKDSEQVYYGDMIDLRGFVKTVFKYKWIVIIVTILSMLVSYVVTKFVLPPKYKASALVGITQSAFEVNLEPSINDTSKLADYRQLIDAADGLPQLAETVEVWLSVCEELNITCLGDGNNKPELKAIMVSSNQLELSVLSGDPEISEKFANLWAAEVVRRWELMYGIDDIDIQYIEEEVNQAFKLWEEYQKMVEDYLPDSQISYLDVQLNQAKIKLSGYYNEIEENERIIRDAITLEDRLNKQLDEGSLLFGDALGLVGLLQRTTGGLSGTQLQIPGPDIFGQKFLIHEARDTVVNLILALQSQNLIIGTYIKDMELIITQIAVDIEAEQYALSLLVNERDRARLNYQIKARYYDESLIIVENNEDVAFNIALAIASHEAESKLILIILITCVLSFGTITCGVNIVVWIRENGLM